MKTKINIAIGTKSDGTKVEFQVIDGGIDCSFKSLVKLDVSNCKDLKVLDCCFNLLTSLDLSKNTELGKLRCFPNQLTALDVSKNTKLRDLYCSFNQLTSLNVSNNTELKYLYCHHNQLTSLDVSKNTELGHLSCASNNLTSLDVSKNKALEDLDCNDNQLTSLDVSKNTKLKVLNCSFNQLTSLDVSKNTELERLDFSNNPLTSITDVTDTHKVEIIDGVITRIEGRYKKLGDFKVVKGGMYASISNGILRWEDCYIATDGDGNFAHGKTIEQAKSDLIFKVTDRTTEDYEHLTLESVLPFDEAVLCYRVITGACSMGTWNFIDNELRTPKEQYSIAEIITLTSGRYGNSNFKNFFEK